MMSNQRPITESAFAETVAIAKLPSEFGQFKIYGYRNTLDNSEHLAIIKGELLQQSGNDKNLVATLPIKIFWGYWEEDFL